ncbi:MAG: glycosyltransferase family 2 protein [Bryobacteraceae bacterium]
MSAVRVSVVLPTHNGEAMLGAAIESVLAQSLRELELIVVLDGCTDGSERIAREYGAADGRVRLVVLRDNRGLPAALNAGFAEARGELWTWTSDDNAYHREALERMARRLEDSGADVVLAGMEVVWEGEEGRVEMFVPPEVDRLRWENVAGACFLYRRRVHEIAGGYDPAERLAEDYGFFLRAWCRGCRFEVLPEVLYRYRMHAKSLTARHGTAVADMRDTVILKHLKEMPTRGGRERARVAVEVGARFLQRGRWMPVMKSLAMAARYSPRVAAGAVCYGVWWRARRCVGA